MNVYCVASMGKWLHQTCRMRAKFYAEPFGEGSTRSALCGMHANQWKRKGYQVTPIEESPDAVGVNEP